MAMGTRNAPPWKNQDYSDQIWYRRPSRWNDRYIQQTFHSCLAWRMGKPGMYIHNLWHCATGFLFCLLYSRWIVQMYIVTLFVAVLSISSFHNIRTTAPRSRMKTQSLKHLTMNNTCSWKHAWPSSFLPLSCLGVGCTKHLRESPSMSRKEGLQ